LRIGIFYGTIGLIEKEKCHAYKTIARLCRRIAYNVRTARLPATGIRIGRAEG
jgi:hypothetical protein